MRRAMAVQRFFVYPVRAARCALRAVVEFYYCYSGEVWRAQHKIGDELATAPLAKTIMSEHVESEAVRSS